MILLVLRSSLRKSMRSPYPTSIMAPRDTNMLKPIPIAAAPVEYCITESPRYKGDDVARFGICCKERRVETDVGKYDSQAVGTDNSQSVLLADLNDLAFQHPSLQARLSETCRQDDGACHACLSALLTIPGTVCAGVMMTARLTGEGTSSKPCKQGTQVHPRQDPHSERGSVLAALRRLVRIWPSATEFSFAVDPRRADRSQDSAFTSANHSSLPC